MFDFRPCFPIASSLILARACTILSRLVHFNSLSPFLQHQPAGSHSSFHSLIDLSEMHIWLCPSSAEMPSCLPKALPLEVKTFKNLVLVYFSRFRSITSSLLLSQVPHTLSPWNHTCHFLFLGTLSSSSWLFVLQGSASTWFSALLNHFPMFVCEPQVWD